MTPTVQQINHDLNFLYTVARTVLPKDILEGLMYGKDFEEPTEENFKEIEEIIKMNQKIEKRKLILTESQKNILRATWDEREDDAFKCPVCGGDYNVGV